MAPDPLRRVPCDARRDGAARAGSDPYNAARIAWELERTALGDGHYGNALRVAKDIPGLSDVDRALLDRYATGRNGGTDHVALQDLAMRIDRGELVEDESVKLRVREVRHG